MRATVYWFLWIPVLMGGCVASFGALSLANAFELRSPSYWVGMLLNLAPALGCGALVYAMAGRRSRSQSRVEGRHGGHVARTAPLYVVGAILFVFIAANRSEPSFGLVAQLFIWPLMACIGGILGDVSRSLASRRAALEAEEPGR